MSDNAVLIIVSSALAAPIFAAVGWYVFVLLRRRPVALRPDESAVARGMAFLRLDDGYMGRLGELVLTNERVVWLPIRFPFPRIAEQSIPLSEVEDCEVGKREWDRFERWLVLRTRAHVFKLRIGMGEQERWRELIRAQIGRLRS